MKHKTIKNIAIIVALLATLIGLCTSCHKKPWYDDYEYDLPQPTFQNDKWPYEWQPDIVTYDMYYNGQNTVSQKIVILLNEEYIVIGVDTIEGGWYGAGRNTFVANPTGPSSNEYVVMPWMVWHLVDPLNLVEPAAVHETWWTTDRDRWPH